MKKIKVSFYKWEKKREESKKSNKNKWSFDFETTKEKKNSGFIIVLISILKHKTFYGYFDRPKQR